MGYLVQVVKQLWSIRQRILLAKGLVFLYNWVLCPGRHFVEWLRLRSLKEAAEIPNFDLEWPLCKIKGERTLYIVYIFTCLQIKMLHTRNKKSYDMTYFLSGKKDKILSISVFEKFTCICAKVAKISSSCDSEYNFIFLYFRHMTLIYFILNIVFIVWVIGH